MNNYEDALDYIAKQEATNISYVKVGDNNKTLIVSFAGNAHDGFARKTGLMKLKYERNDFDVLYLRNLNKWYLGELNGVGKNIDHTVQFLKKQFSDYNKVLCIGQSAGGYASLLFGSLLNVNKVIALIAQTDLQYCIDNLEQNRKDRLNLISYSTHYPTVWSKYNNIVGVLNNDVSYSVFYEADDVYKLAENFVFHGYYHYDQIKHFPNVSKFNSMDDAISLIEKILDESH